MIRMSEIAREAGVSRYTVSKVLNGDLSVKKGNRDKVLEACSRYGYAPNPHAVGLVRGRTNTIAMVVPYITDAFFSEIVEIAEREASLRSYQLIYKSTYNDAAVEAEVIKNFLALKVCAMIIVPSVIKPDMHIHQLAAETLPLIYLDRPLPGSTYLVANDNLNSGKTMTGYLIGKGRPPAYLDSFYHHDNTAIRDRRNGYRQAMIKSGLTPVFIPNEFSQEQQDNEKFGYDNTLRFLAENPAPPALFCVTDAVALGAMHAAAETGCRPGQDILIAGHDDLPFSAYIHPSLTTMRQPKELLGQTCIDLADKLIKNQKLSKAKYIFKSELLVRKSA